MSDYADKWAEGLKGWKNIHALLTRSTYCALRPWFGKRDRAMELGCGDGTNTAQIAADFGTVVVIDHSTGFLKMAASRVRGPSVHYIHSSVEEYNPHGLHDLYSHVDAIFAINILEHLENPVEVLKKFKAYLNPGGRLLISVPNARSLHRLLGVETGLLPHIRALNDQDRLLGHHRVYDAESLMDDLDAAGLEHGPLTGSFVKPLSARQMNDWDPKILRGLDKLGKQLFGHAADLCVAAWNQDDPEPPSYMTGRDLRL